MEEFEIHFEKFKPAGALMLVAYFMLTGAPGNPVIVPPRGGGVCPGRRQRPPPRLGEWPYSCTDT
jgi:hypothetical protein